MQANRRLRNWFLAGCGMSGLLLGTLTLLATSPRQARAGSPWFSWSRRCCGESAPGACEEWAETGSLGGTWYWLRSPDEEKRVVAGLYNRYCIRCHGVDGRGVWDIPDVPNFTNPRWQACRSDGQLARIIIEGRGAVMPPFRGTLTLEESWAMARYLRTFVPGTEVSRPNRDRTDHPIPPADVPAAKKNDMRK